MAKRNDALTDRLSREADIKLRRDQLSSVQECVRKHFSRVF